MAKAINIKTPSSLDIFLADSAKINKAIEEPINIMISIIWKLLGVIVPYIATGIPSTIHILKMLLPMILPISKSCSPFLEDTIVVINSGKLVPKAIMVKAIILSLKPNS